MYVLHYTAFHQRISSEDQFLQHLKKIILIQTPFYRVQHNLSNSFQISLYIRIHKSRSTCKCLSNNDPIKSSLFVYVSADVEIFAIPKYPEARRIPSKTRAIADLVNKSSGHLCSFNPTKFNNCKYLSSLYSPIQLNIVFRYF